MEYVLVTLRRRFQDEWIDEEGVDIELPVDVSLSEVISYCSERLWAKTATWTPSASTEYLVQKLDHTRNPTLDIHKSILNNEQGRELTIYDGDILLVSLNSRSYGSPLKHAPNVNQPTLQCIWSGQIFPLDNREDAITIGIAPEAVIRTDILLDGSFTDPYQARIEHIYKGNIDYWCIYDGWSAGEGSKNGTYLKYLLAPTGPNSIIFPVEGEESLVSSDRPVELRNGVFICLGERVKRGPVLRFVLPR